MSQPLGECGTAFSIFHAGLPLRGNPGLWNKYNLFGPFGPSGLPLALWPGKWYSHRLSPAVNDLVTQQVRRGQSGKIPDIVEGFRGSFPRRDSPVPRCCRCPKSPASWRPSHHGKDPNKIEQLKMLETEKMKTLRNFLKKLKDTKEDGVTLLDRTTVFFSSNLADASTHGVKNMPVLLAGGGFKHGRHLAFDPKNNPPLCNLYVSMLQRLGLEVDKFGSSTGTLTGLEMSR